MMAARRALVIPVNSRRAELEPNQQLITQHLGGGRDVVDRKQLVAVTPNERSDVADLTGKVSHVEHDHVHGHYAGDPRALATDEGDPSVAQRSAISVRVPDAQRCDSACSAGAPRRTVTHGLAVLDASDLEDASPEVRDRLGRHGRPVASADAVQENPGPREVPG